MAARIVTAIRGATRRSQRAPARRPRSRPDPGARRTAATPMTAATSGSSNSATEENAAGSCASAYAINVWPPACEISASASSTVQACRLGGSNVSPDRQCDRQQRQCGDGRAPRDDGCGRAACIAQALDRQQVHGVAACGRDAEQIAQRLLRADREAARPSALRCPPGPAAIRSRTAKPRPLAIEEPCRERHEHRREIGEQGRIRDRGELDRPVPERQIAGEAETHYEQSDGMRPRSAWSRVRRCESSAQVHSAGAASATRQNADGDRTHFRKAHEDRREADRGRAQDERSQAERRAIRG